MKNNFNHYFNHYHFNLTFINQPKLKFETTIFIIIVLTIYFYSFIKLEFCFLLYDLLSFFF